MGQWQKAGWLEFEHEVRDLVEAFGYQAETTQPSHDQGIDVVAVSPQRKVVVQCKLYARGAVGGPTILQLIGSRTLERATDAICVTTGRFTRQARKIAEQEAVHLVDREKLVELCQKRALTIPSLTQLSGSAGTWDLHAPRAVVGREQGSHIRLADGRVSRQHACLERSGLRLTIQDLGSGNGTWLNGIRVHARMPVNYGDELRFGTTVLAVTLRE